MNILSNRDNIVVSELNSVQINTFEQFRLNSSKSDITVEIFVNDASTLSLIDVYRYDFKTLLDQKLIKLTKENSKENTGYLIINNSELLKFLGFKVGSYNVKFKFFKSILGNISTSYFIKKVSPSKKEIIIHPLSFENNLSMESFISDYFFRFDENINLNKFIKINDRNPNIEYGNYTGDNEVLILNAKDYEIDNEKAIILKLYEPLNKKYSVNDKLYIIELICDVDPLDETLDINFLSKINPLDSANILKPPKMDVYDNINFVHNTYKSYNDLIDTSSLGDKYFSEYFYKHDVKGIDLNTKFRHLEEFTHFGSSYQRLINFKKKLELIESYTDNITSSIDGYYKTSSLYYEDKKRNVIGTFTPYENFLYFKSGSYFSSSLFLDANGTASAVDMTAPKIGSSIDEYELYSTTSSQFINWYNTMSVIMGDFDSNNEYSLLNTIPTYIKEDELDNFSNTDYLLFINMIGEFFDHIWIYIKDSLRTIRRENKFEDGTPEELIWNVLKNYGFNLNNGNDLVNISRYNYGYYLSGSTITELDNAEKIVTHEIWNRILNNYIYIFKSKGTSRSIRTLFNCFGIPSSLIQIQEFGGPEITSSLNSSHKKYSFTYEDFTFVLDMTGSEYISVPWVTSSYDSMVPDSIEFKFRTPNTVLTDVDLFSITGSSGELKLQLQKEYDSFGKLSLEMNSYDSGSIIVTSSIKPFYNNEFYSILVNRSFESDVSSIAQNYYLKIKSHDNYINTITIDESHYISIDGTVSSSFNDIYSLATNFYLGGHPDSTTKFNGGFDEFRLWAEILDDDTFDYHTKYSTATNGNELTSSLQTLAFRLSFNIAENLYESSSLENEAYITSSYASTASAVGFYNNTEFPYHFSDYERSNTIEQSFIATEFQNNKVRIENNYIDYIDSGSTRLYPLYGNYVINGEMPKGQIGDFDNSPEDVDILLIGFSPVDLMNKDIIAFYGNNDILGVYGDFNEYYSDYYSKNNDLISTYWTYTKNQISFENYINYIKIYDRTLFDLVETVVPGNSTLILGAVYDQNILRRNKIRRIKPEVATNYDEKLFLLNEYPERDIRIENSNNETSLIKITSDGMISLEDVTYENIGGIKKDVYKIEKIEGIVESEGGDITYRLNPYNHLALNDLTIQRQRFNRNKDVISGTKNSSLTSADRLPAVIVTKSSKTNLYTNYSDQPRLLVRE